MEKADYQREWRLKNPDKIRAYREADRAKQRKRRAQSRTLSRCRLCDGEYRHHGSNLSHWCRPCGRAIRFAAIVAPPPAQRDCEVCGKAYTPAVRQNTTDRRFCSRRCKNADTRHRRRALIAGVRSERYSIAKIAGRDGYLCGICWHPIDMELRSPDPMSPSIDHVIPLSQGGENTPDNVQLAHRGCNSRKQAAVPPAQLYIDAA